MTSSPPAACRHVNGSSRLSALVSATLTGPTAPISAKRLAPMRLSASAWRNTGSTVLKVAMMAAYHHTAAGSSRAKTGSNTRKCTAAGPGATNRGKAGGQLEGENRLEHEELHCGRHGGNEHGKRGEAHGAHPFHHLAAGDEVDRVTKRGGERQEHAEDEQPALWRGVDLVRQHEGNS